MLRRRHTQSKGQALVEFALILTVLLMLMFLIIESARILQGWVTVQNAARNGARYAVTGQVMSPCATQNLAKFQQICQQTDPDLRLAAVIQTTHDALAGLPLDESATANPYRDINGNPPDDNSYDIEVFGGFIGTSGAELRPGFAGQPGQVVVVRAVYNVPIISPFFRPIISTVPVFGQVTMNNESFGQLGNPTQGMGIPPELEPVPTVGATPTPSPSPTATETPTPGDTSTPTPTASNTPSPTPTYCGAFFEETPVDGRNYVFISGELNATVTIIDLTTGQTLGTDTFVNPGGTNPYNCPGFADFSAPNQLVQPLQTGHVILAVPSQGQPVTSIVLQGTATPTPTPTTPPTLTPTPTSSPTTAPTSTPTGPFILLSSTCSVGSTAQFTVRGYNWPNNENIVISFGGSPYSLVPSGHGGTFIVQVTQSNLTVGTPGNPQIYAVQAVSNSASDSVDFEVPCANVTPTVSVPPTNTPSPADLIIVGPPQLVSTRPLVAYEPIEVSMVISNVGGIDVSSQFFVDLYFNPAGSISPTIPLSYSVGYMAISSLPGGASRVITITAPGGFQNSPLTHNVYGMVDSLETAMESDETNNVAGPLVVGSVTPGVPPTTTPTPPPGTDAINGVVRALTTSWVPQGRTMVTLINETSGLSEQTVESDRNGFYQFLVLPGIPYTVRACTYIDNISYAGLRTGNVAPVTAVANLYMLPGPCP
ncbi:MAG: pilus assembly protein [Anaerolineales bacterium]|nr:pilus assembly protein [Anaerolineales bacterium]